MLSQGKSGSEVSIAPIILYNIYIYDNEHMYGITLYLVTSFFLHS